MGRPGRLTPSPCTGRQVGRRGWHGFAGAGPGRRGGVGGRAASGMVAAAAEWAEGGVRVREHHSGEERPPAAESRIAEIRRSGTWGSALSADEFTAIKGVGFEPVGQVLGAAVYNIGYTGGWACPGGWAGYGGGAAAPPKAPPGGGWGAPGAAVPPGRAPRQRPPHR